MLNLICRPVAPTARARLIRWASPLAFLCALSVLPLQAAETMPMEKGMASPSPLETYRKWHDEPLQDWVAANDRVGEIGGWMTYLREAQPAEGGAGQTGHDHHGHPGH